MKRWRTEEPLWNTSRHSDYNSLALWVNTGAAGAGGGCVIVGGIESLSIVWKGIDST